MWCGKMFVHLGFYQYKAGLLLLLGSGGKCSEMTNLAMTGFAA